MTDVLSHLIDAPLPNVLILAGLAFLAIVVLGKISGKVEPSTTGRIMSGVLGAVLLVYGIYGHNTADTAAHNLVTPKALPARNTTPPQDATLAAGPLAGVWVNDNPQTRGITKIVVEQKGDALTVHAWGACHPQDCDWGSERGLGNNNSVSVAWDQSFVLRKMTISADGTRLRMEMDSVYRDNRPAQHAREFFVKGR
jgi:hypothetical protein